MEIDEEDRDKTAFTSHRGPNRLIRMPIGVRNAPGTFQRIMDVILSSIKWQFIFVYLDNIVIFSKSPEQYRGLTRKVLTIFENAGVTLKLKK